ncbi:MAG TPA: sugar phosphate nucleotidyltransferase [Tepidisphaeraceae bacterium]|nr:sugar phosphate nucleotidyltransferase [Tepidisphaeraceae bacterium]
MKQAPLHMNDVPAALLAGGLATRLRPITDAIPKALIDVNGRPFVDHQLELLHRHGVREVVLCLGHLGEQIESYLGDGDSRGLRLRYSYDGDAPAGTAGALRWALPFLGDVFWVMYGDSYMDIDYAGVLENFWVRQTFLSARVCERGHSCPPSDRESVRGNLERQTKSYSPPARPLGLMTVIRNDDRWDRSNVVFQDQRLCRYDKRHRVPEMRHVDYGVQLLRREALLHLAPGESADLADVYRDLTVNGQMIGHEVHNRFYEIGTPDALDEARRFMGREQSPAGPYRRVSA